MIPHSQSDFGVASESGIKPACRDLLVQSTSQVRQVAGRCTLYLVLALFLVPLPAAWLSYSYWPPQRLANYGELLPPTPFLLPDLSDAAGQLRTWADLRGKWVLLVVAPPTCADSCLRAAYLARQVRLAQGREQGRVACVFLGVGTERNWPFAETAYRGVLSEASGVLARGGLYLLDPTGHLILRFPQTPDGSRVIADLRRLLLASRRD